MRLTPVSAAFIVISVLLTAAGLLQCKLYVSKPESFVFAKPRLPSHDQESQHRSRTDARDTSLPRKFVTKLQRVAERGPSIQRAAKTQAHNHVAPEEARKPGWEYLPRPAIVLFCYNRAEYLQQTIASMAGLPELNRFATYISQDGNDSAVTAVISAAVETNLKPPITKTVTHWQHQREPLLGANQPSHAWLTQHYKWSLGQLFDKQNHSHVIILEDDMLFSQDFLTYFSATAPLLEEDPTLWCISTWNDNGLAHLDWKNDRLFRTSYFPGLGWMLHWRIWQELRPKFPLQAWDHWMRLDATSQGRECICPEVNRNRNIGKRGANMQTSVFKKYLEHMQWSLEPPVSWGNLSYLLLPSYRSHLQKLVTTAELWIQPPTKRALAASMKGKVWLIPYKGEHYIRLARAFQIWPFPRAHHHHIGLLPYNGSMFLLADQRFCTLLPDSLRIFPHPTLQPAAGGQGQDCDTVCRNISLLCHAEDFWFINTCEQLTKHFPCERGCAVELGSDVPNYVISPSLPTFRTCLVTQTESKCTAAHPDTRRLCPCVSAP